MVRIIEITHLSLMSFINVIIIISNILCRCRQIGANEVNIGYQYPRPKEPFIEGFAKTNDTQESFDGTEESVGMTGVVQMDFIDDIINQHKSHIFASLEPDQDIKATNLFNKCASCSCGIANINRIVGGHRVQTYKYPWIVQLARHNFVFCGGSLINTRYILTAAHCVLSSNTRSLTVRLLQLDRGSKDTGISRKIIQILRHSGFRRATLLNDIALLKMDQPVPLLEPLRPVCLPSSTHQNFDYKQAVVAGWGATSDLGSNSYVLQEVTVPIITNVQCRATSYKSMIVDTVLCAGYVGSGGKDACQGDSGGPLIVYDKIYRLAGLVSFGSGCAKPDSPGVYTRVSRYLEWIAANTKDACYCKY